MYAAAFMLVYVPIAAFDNAFDTLAFGDTLAGHDAERALSAAFEIGILLGLMSLWLYGAWSWWAGVAVGLLTAMAAGGAHVLPYVGILIVVAAAAAGCAGGFALIVTTHKHPLVCIVFAIDLALAVVQVLFVFASL